MITKKVGILLIVVVQILALTLLSCPNLKAQYLVAIGNRTGGTSGLVGKYFYKDGAAIEGILGSFGNGFSLTSLVEKYDAIYSVKGLYAFHGIGAHVAVYHGNNRYIGPLGREVRNRKNNDIGVGINGIFGVEYRMPRRIPLSFCIDLKPFVEFGSGRVSVAPDPSIGIKFIIR